MNGKIPELDALDLVDEAEARYQLTYHAPVLNLSHWDPSAEIRQKLIAEFILPVHDNDPVNYIYPYTITSSADVQQHLGLPACTCVVITPSSTPAIMEILRHSVERGCRKLRIVKPHYFSIPHAAQLLGLEIEAIDTILVDGVLTMPQQALQTTAESTLLVTNPVFSTSVPISNTDVLALDNYLRKGGNLILDECLACMDSLVGPRLTWTPGLSAIYSPHKAALTNGIKFAAIACHPTSISSHHQWSDVVIGGLPASSRIAVEHFCSSNFETFISAVRAILTDAHATLQECVSSHKKFKLLCNVSGHFATILVDHLPSDYLDAKDRLWDFISSTGASILTGRRNNAPDCWGLNFRINLARSSPPFWRAVSRVLNYLESE